MQVDSVESRPVPKTPQWPVNILSIAANIIRTRLIQEGKADKDRGLEPRSHGQDAIAAEIGIAKGTMNTRIAVGWLDPTDKKIHPNEIQGWIKASGVPYEALTTPPPSASKSSSN